MAWVAVISAASIGGALAHATGARVLGNNVTTVELYYTGGEPMAYVETKVFSPDAPDVPFINGRADRLGRISFAANRDGIWRIEAHDNEGHKVQTEVTITSGAPAGRLSRCWRA